MPKDERNVHQQKTAYVLLESYQAAERFLNPLLHKNGLPPVITPAELLQGQTASRPWQSNFLYDLRGRHIQAPSAADAPMMTEAMMRKAYSEGAHFLR